MSTKAKKKTVKKAKSGHSIVWFEIPADDIARAKSFYGKLFGWNITPFPGMESYQHIDTAGPDATPDGGMMSRMYPGHTITTYVSVPSVTRFMAKVEKLGGKVCKPKTAVPGFGYFAICQDTEKNMFAIWEMNPKAK